jgi:hypothetical protein
MKRIVVLVVGLALMACSSSEEVIPSDESCPATAVCKQELNTLCARDALGNMLRDGTEISTSERCTGECTNGTLVGVCLRN